MSDYVIPLVQALRRIANELEKIRKLKEIELTIVHLEDRIEAIERGVNNE